MTFILSKKTIPTNPRFCKTKPDNECSVNPHWSANSFMPLSFINPCCTIISNQFALVAQWIRALACGVRGRVFESRRGCYRRSGNSRSIFVNKNTWPKFFAEKSTPGGNQLGWRNFCRRGRYHPYTVLYYAGKKPIVTSPPEECCNLRNSERLFIIPQESLYVKSCRCNW